MFMPQFAAAVVGIFGGAAWCGFNIARTNLEYSFVDNDGRSTYGASVYVLMAITGVAGGILAGAMAKWTANFHLHIGSVELINYHLIWLISGIFRVSGVIWLIRMPEPNAKPVGIVARQIAQGVLHTVPGILFTPIRTVRRLLVQPAAARPPGQMKAAAEEQT